AFPARMRTPGPPRSTWRVAGGSTCSAPAAGSSGGERAAVRSAIEALPAGVVEHGRGDLGCHRACWGGDVQGLAHAGAATGDQRERDRAVERGAEVGRGDVA